VPSISRCDARQVAQSAYVPGSIRTTSPLAATVAAWLGTFNTRIGPTGSSRPRTGRAQSIAAAKAIAVCQGRVIPAVSAEDLR
jgi:hypothetical protein